MSWNDKNMIATSSGGTDYPLGSVVFIHSSESAPSGYIDAGKYPISSSDLYTLKGYPIDSGASVIGQTDVYKSTDLGFFGSRTFITSDALKMVSVAFSNYVEITSSGNENVVSGSYFADQPDQPDNYSYGDTISNPNDGYTYCSSIYWYIDRADVTNRVYLNRWFASDTIDPNVGFPTPGSYGTKYKFTEDDRLLAEASNKAAPYYGGFYLSEPGDYTNGQNYMSTLTSNTNSKYGVAIDANYVYVADSIDIGANPSFIKYDRNLLTWERVYLIDLGFPISGSSNRIAISSSSFDDDTVIINWSSSNQAFGYKKITNGGATISDLITIDSIGETSYEINPVNGGKNMWYLRTSNDSKSFVSIDNADSFQEILPGDDINIVDAAYSSELDVFVTSSSDTYDSMYAYYDSIHAPGTDFFVPASPTVTLEHTAYHKA